MKPKSNTRLAFPLAAAIAALLSAPFAQAANYYWDTDGNASGLGDTVGTWGTSTFWASMNAGSSRIIISGKQATANTPIAVGDTVYFGTVNLALGSTASTIGITGAGVNANRIVFGAGQGSQGVTLSSGGGNITLSNSGASIVANNAGNNTVGAILAGTVGLVKGGSGTVFLTATNLFTGGVTVSGGGTLQVGDGTSGSLTSQNLSFNNGGGVFHVQSVSTGAAQAMGTLTFSATGVGDGTIQSTYGSSGNAELSFTSLAARGAGATSNFVVAGGSNGTTNKIVLTGAATGFLDKGLFFGGNSYAAYDATGYVRGLIYGTDTDAEVADTITADRHVQLTTAPAARPGDTLLSLHLSGGAVDYTMDSGSLTLPAILKSGGGALSTISGGDSLTTASNAELVIRTDSSSDLLTISSAVTGFSGGLTKTGAGTLTLSGGNGYTGATRINGGTLDVNGGSAIADNQGVVLADAAGGTFRLNSNETILNITGGGLSGGTVDTQGNTLTLSSNAGYTFGGQLTGTAGGGIIKQGAGTLILSQQNSFAGSLTLEGGALEFTYGNDGTGTLIALSSGGAFNMANGTTLRFNPLLNLPWGTFGAQLQAANGGSPAYPYGWVFANDINITDGTASIRVTGNENTVRFTGDVTGGTSGGQTLAIYSGGISTGSGDRQANAFTGTIQNGSGGTLGVNVDFAGYSGPNQKAFVNLSGQNTFTGPINVTNSRGLVADLYLGIGGEIHSSTAVFVTGDGYLGGGNYMSAISLVQYTTLAYLSSADQTLGGEISGAGSLLKRGGGALTLSAANIYTGATTVSEGTLLVNNTTGSATGTNSVSVTAGTLGGNGFITGAVTIGNSTGAADAILAPGNSIDSIDTGNLTFNSDGRYACELNGSLATSDQTNVTGTVTIHTSATLAVSLTGSLAGSQKYFIVTNDDVDAVTGTFAGLAQDAVVGNFDGTDLKISYTGDSGTSAISGGNDIVLYTDASGSTPYDTWTTTGPFANPPFSNTLPEVDFDNDGLSNLLEFVLGGDPTISQAGIAPTVSTSGSNLVMVFKRSDASELAPAVTVKVELSTDLSFSTPADDITIGPATDAGPIAPSGASYTVSNSGGFDTITLTIPQGAAPKKFARIKAVKP